MAVDAAAGLAAAGGSRDAARLLRAAEGLLRTAIAQLGVPPASLEPAADAGPPTAQRRRRPRGRGRGHGGGDASPDNDGDVKMKQDGMEAAGVPAASGDAVESESMLDDEWADALPVQRSRPLGSTGLGKGKDKNKGTDDADVYKDTDSLEELRKKIARLKNAMGLTSVESDDSENPLQLKVVMSQLLILKKAGVVAGAPRRAAGAAG